MAEPVFKHQDDDGDLSIFASGDVVLLACANGHYWVLDAEQKDMDAARAAVTDRLSPNDAEQLMRLL